MEENPITVSTPEPAPAAASKPALPKWLIIIIGVILLIIIVGVAGWASANAAASNYQKQHAAYLKSAQQTAAKATNVNFSSLMNINASETLAQYAAEQSECQTIQTLAKGQSQNSPKAPTLSGNFFAKSFSFLSPTYRSAEQQQKANTTAADSTTMYAHLQRLSNACQFYVAAIGNYQPDLPNRPVRDALLVHNGTNGIFCLHAATTCLPRYNVAAYKAADATRVAEDKGYVDLFATQCDYPELKAECAEIENLWTQDYPLEKQYYDNLTPTGDYDTPSEQLVALDAQWEADVFAALQKSQPALAKAVGSDNTDTLVTHLLMQRDEQAIHAAAQNITHAH